MNARNNRFSRLGPVTGLGQTNWYDLHDLKTLDISDNYIEDDITDFLSRLPYPPEASGIRELSFNDNLFSGEIDCYKQFVLPLGKIGTVERFIGANNRIRGTLGRCFVAPLKEIDLENNLVTGISGSHLNIFFMRSLEWYGGRTLTNIKLMNNRVHPVSL